MKKNALYTLFLAALAFAGCKGDYDDWAAPQGFEQEEARSVSLTVTGAPAIDMETVTTDSIVLFTPSVEMGEGDSVVGYQLVLDGTQNVPVSLEGKASVEELRNAVVALYGQAPVTREMSGVVTGAIYADGSVMSVTAAAFTLSVTLHADFLEFIYMPNDNQNWDTETAPALCSPNFDGLYKGYTYLTAGSFKFNKSRATDWSDGEYAYSDFQTFSENLTEGSGGNITIDKAGYYQIVADAANATLTATEITTWGIVGDVLGEWPGEGVEGANDVELTYNATDDCWEATGVELQVGAFKFRANKAWDIGLGGAMDDLSDDGGAGNLTLETAGTYTVKLYLGRTATDKMYCTLEAQ